MNSKERRKLRHQRNIEKDTSHKKEAWDSGKLIEENHNGGPYSSSYTSELADRLIDRLVTGRTYILGCTDNDPVLLKNGGVREQAFIGYYRRYKNKIKTLILHWSPDVKKDNRYNFLKWTLETYWDNPENLLYGK